MSFARARALAVIGTLVLAAIVLVVTAVVRDRQPEANYGPGGCPPGKIKISTKLPPPSEIKLNVYNGTGQVNPKAKDKVINGVAGLAEQVADDLRNRDFKVVKVGSSPQNFGGVAKISYGPKTVAAAVVVRAWFLDGIDPGGFDIKRTDDTIDLTLGSGFRQLGNRTDVNGKIAQLTQDGQPSPPPGTCDAGT